jgi:hypothetical protein
MAPRNSSADASPRVQVPGADADRPSWTRVGVIAAIGFVVGVAWPRLAGVRLGPSVPEAAASASASALPSSSVMPPAAPPPVPATATASDSPGASPPAARPTRPAEVPVTTASPGAEPASGPSSVAVGHGVVTSCRTTSGDTLKGGDCGAIAALDGIVVPRLRKLAACPAAAGATGKVRLSVRADFARGALSVDLGRGAPPANADAWLACARSELRGASLGSIAHENARYNVAYALTFAGSGSDAEPAAPVPAAAVVAPAVPEASDEVAQVAWDVALVRDAPKTGKVLARLQRGTTVHAGPANEGWVPVKYGDGFASDGWVYHGAIGR